MAALLPADAAEAAKRSAGLLKSRLGDIPPFAVITGSGWDPVLEGLPSKGTMTFEEAGLPGPGVEGHAGNISLRETGSGDLLVQEGRLHTYEGFSALEVALSVLVMAELDVRVILMLNAAGSLMPASLPGDLLVTADHIYFSGDNPLRGVPDSEGRSKFVWTGNAYPEDLREMVKMCLPPGTPVEKGAYAFVGGPTYETETEAIFLRLAGADAVGMSTVPEALMARYAGIRVAALSCLSNVILPYTMTGLTHSNVLEVVRLTASNLTGFLENFAAQAYMIL
jgi:purine-nucleoside phosphorylase